MSCHKVLGCWSYYYISHAPLAFLESFWTDKDDRKTLLGLILNRFFVDVDWRNGDGYFLLTNSLGHGFFLADTKWRSAGCENSFLRNLQRRHMGKPIARKAFGESFAAAKQHWFGGNLLHFMWQSDCQMLLFRICKNLFGTWNDGSACRHRRDKSQKDERY